MTDLIGQEFGQYHITALLGLGGMATVYRARQSNMDRDVAIKVIKPELGEMKDFTARFEREAKMLASLSHLHILKVFDYGQYKNMWYLVMEMLTSGNLADLIARGPLPLETALRIFQQVASALDYAHRRGIIHRDLKPQNVLLDEDHNGFLTDFGLAKLIDATSKLTHSGMAIGTPSYMPPEQWTGGAIDGRSDIYSLGIMLFEMLSGTLPFDGDTPFRLMHMHVYEQPRLLFELNPNIPPEVDEVIATALAKRSEERFVSAGAMAMALRDAIKDYVSPALLPPVLESGATNPVTLLPAYEQPPANAAPTLATAAKTLPLQVTPEAKPPVRWSLTAGLGVLGIVVIVGLIAVLIGQSSRASQLATELIQTAVVTLRAPEGMPPPGANVPPGEVFAIAQMPTDLRAGPGERNPVVYRMEKQERLPMVAMAHGDGGVWFQVRLAANAFGWVSDRKVHVFPPGARVPMIRPDQVAVLAFAKAPVDLRAGPGENYSIVRRLEPGEPAPIVAVLEGEGTAWFQVQLAENAFAWVPDKAVDVNPPGAQVPAVTLTPGS